MYFVYLAVFVFKLSSKQASSSVLDVVSIEKKKRKRKEKKEKDKEREKRKKK